MTALEMLEQSAILTVLGVGVVFSFLLIMIICVTLMGKIIRKVNTAGTGHKGGLKKSDQRYKMKEFLRWN